MEEERKTSSSSEKVLEVESKKIIIGGNVFTVTKRRDINDTIGEKLSRAETKESLVTVVKQNGEKTNEEEKEKSKFKAKYILPILLVAAIPLMVHSCTKENNIEDKIIKETIPIEFEIYDIENPYKDLEGIVNSYGQEGLTGNNLEGEGIEGSHYSGNEQFKAEEQASSGVIEFEDMKKEISYNIAILTAENSTQEQKYEAAKALLELQQQAESIYINNESMAKEYAQKFKETSEAFKDSNTDNEKEAVDLMYQSYIEELGLASYNAEEMQEIVSLLEQGYDLEIETVEQELDGDYEITGKAVREVVKGQDINKSKTVWQKFANFVKGRSDKEIEK